MEKLLELKDAISESDLVLIGLGDEFNTFDDNSKVLNAYNAIAKEIADKNYFVVSLCEDELIFDSDFDKEKITAPYSTYTSKNLKDDEEDPQWGKYMLWLSCTLNKKLLIIEIGASVLNPHIMRWPFEKTVELNNKAKLIRVNSVMPNVPAEISDKCISIKSTSIEFCL